MHNLVSNFNWFDITLVAIVLISTIFAAVKGFIKSILSLVKWAISVSTTVFLYPHSSKFLETKINNEKLVVAASILGVFLIIFILVSILNSSISFRLRRASGGFIDIALGFLFGASRGIMTVCIIFFSVNAISEMLNIGKNNQRSGPEWFAKSATYDVVKKATDDLQLLFPEKFSKELKNLTAQIKEDAVAATSDNPDSALLSEENRGIIKKIAASLSQDDLDRVYKKYQGNEENVSEAEKAETFKKMIDMYKEKRKDGKINSENIVDSGKLDSLERILSKTKYSTNKSQGKDETGYKNNNIKQLDRLVDGVK